MVDHRTRRALATAAGLLAVAALISACQQTGADPFDAGQIFRQQVDLFLKDAGQFVAGFCSSAALPGALLAVLAALGALRSGR